MYIYNIYLCIYRVFPTGRMGGGAVPSHQLKICSSPLPPSRLPPTKFLSPTKSQFPPH